MADIETNDTKDSREKEDKQNQESTKTATKDGQTQSQEDEKPEKKDGQTQSQEDERKNDDGKGDSERGALNLRSSSQTDITLNRRDSGQEATMETNSNGLQESQAEASGEKPCETKVSDLVSPSNGEEMSGQEKEGRVTPPGSVIAENNYSTQSPSERESQHQSQEGNKNQPGHDDIHRSQSEQNSPQFEQSGPNDIQLDQSRQGDTIPDQSGHSDTQFGQSGFSDTHLGQSVYGDADPDQSGHGDGEPDQSGHGDDEPDQTGHGDDEPDPSGHDVQSGLGDTKFHQLRDNTTHLHQSQQDDIKYDQSGQSNTDTSESKQGKVYLDESASGTTAPGQPEKGKPALEQSEDVSTHINAEHSSTNFDHNSQSTPESDDHKQGKSVLEALGKDETEASNDVSPSERGRLEQNQKQNTLASHDINELYMHKSDRNETQINESYVDHDNEVKQTDKGSTETDQSNEIKLETDQSNEIKLETDHTQSNDVEETELKQTVMVDGERHLAENTSVEIDVDSKTADQDQVDSEQIRHKQVSLDNVDTVNSDTPQSEQMQHDTEEISKSHSDENYTAVDFKPKQSEPDEESSQQYHKDQSEVDKIQSEKPGHGPSDRNQSDEDDHVERYSPDSQDDVSQRRHKGPQPPLSTVYVLPKRNSPEDTPLSSRASSQLQINKEETDRDVNKNQNELGEGNGVVDSVEEDQRGENEEGDINGDKELGKESDNADSGEQECRSKSELLPDHQDEKLNSQIAGSEEDEQPDINAGDDKSNVEDIQNRESEPQENETLIKMNGSSSSLQIDKVHQERGSYEEHKAEGDVQAETELNQSTELEKQADRQEQEDIRSITTGPAATSSRLDVKQDTEQRAQGQESNANDGKQEEDQSSPRVTESDANETTPNEEGRASGLSGGRQGNNVETERSASKPELRDSRDQTPPPSPQKKQSISSDKLTQEAKPDDTSEGQEQRGDDATDSEEKNVSPVREDHEEKDSKSGGENEKPKAETTEREKVVADENAPSSAVGNDDDVDGQGERGEAEAGDSMGKKDSTVVSKKDDSEGVTPRAEKTTREDKAKEKTEHKEASRTDENRKPKSERQQKVSSPETPRQASTSKPGRSTACPQPSSRSRTSFGSEAKSSSSRRLRREATRSQTRTSSRPRTTTTMRSRGDQKKERKKKKEKKKESEQDKDGTDEGRSKQKEFFKEELKRLEEGLQREKSKIHKPPVKKHIPYIFNTLEPYYNTRTVRYLIELPEEMKHSFTSRRTAIGLCDPWVDLDMDQTVLPRIESRSVNRHQELMKKERMIKERENKPRKEGSTRLPKFPVVTLETKDLATKQLTFGDVPMLREELRQKYSSNAKGKIDEDYSRTRKDFYRMELDKMEEVHPLNRPHMRSAYFAYLQNTPGSRKAVYECVKQLETEGAN